MCPPVRNQLPLGLAIEPTPSMTEGSSYVAQCAWCGLLACVVTINDDPPLPPPTKLGPCPACGGTTWWQQALPVGPFRSAH